MLVFCSALSGAGATTTALNVAHRLAHYGEALVLDCDLTGAGATAIAQRAAASHEIRGLSDVLQDGVYLSPGALLDRALHLRAGGSGERACPKSLWIIPGRSPDNGTLADELVGGPRPNPSLGAGLVERNDASRRVEELLSILIDWSSWSDDERWVVIDVPAHPFVAPLIVRTVARVFTETSGDAVTFSRVRHLVLGCFAWNVEQLSQARRLTRLARGHADSFDVLCTRGAVAGGRAPTAVDLRRALHHGHGARPAPPIIPFVPVLLERSRIVETGQAPPGDRLAEAYDALVAWIRALDT